MINRDERRRLKRGIRKRDKNIAGTDRGDVDRSVVRVGDRKLIGGASAEERRSRKQGRGWSHIGGRRSADALVCANVNGRAAGARVAGEVDCRRGVWSGQGRTSIKRGA